MNEPAKQSAPDAGPRPSLEEAWEEAEYLPCKLSVALQVPKLTVGDLLDMELNSVIDCRVSRDRALPVWVNEVIIGWAEFDVVGRRLAVRITELR
jgi:flagellar motor switch/type III secretory pathway protein FliN